MNEGIHSLLNRLGDTIEAHITAANDRAVAAENQIGKLRDGLRTLLTEPANLPRPVAANDEGGAPTAHSSKSQKPQQGKAQASAFDPFLNVLTGSWQTADALRIKLEGAGVKVSLGTVYNKMRKLAQMLPDRVEEASSPQRWRLSDTSHSVIAAVGDDGSGDTRVARRRKKADRLENPSDGMSPKAITDVRQRVANLPAPAQMFAPTLHHADCLDVLKSMADQSVELILADPPYGTTELAIDPKIDIAALWAEYRRVITPTGNIVMFGSQPFTSKVIMKAADLFKYNLVWIKNRATGSLQCRNRPLKQHEDIMIFSPGAAISESRSARRCTYEPIGQASGGRKTISASKHTTYLDNVTHHPGKEYESTANCVRSTIYCAKDRKGLHPFQKPVALLEYLIHTYSKEGDTVLDTFLGSGSTCVAAMRAGRRSIGIEMDANYFAIATDRLRAEGEGRLGNNITSSAAFRRPRQRSSNDNAAPNPTYGAKAQERARDEVFGRESVWAHQRSARC